MEDFKNFYPTPESLIKKMIKKLDLKRCKNILEPSAGKGDIVKALNFEKKYIGKQLKIKAIEIDPNMRSILKEFVTVVGDDFLKFKTFSRYDTIVMNPPFDNADKHLLKAIELLNEGGQIVCVMNAETIKNPYSNIRKILVEKLNELDANIEFLENEFSYAERKTDVEIALIYIDIKEKEQNFDIFEKLKKSIEFENEEFKKENSQLAINDIDRSLVQQYEYECRIGIESIRNFKKCMSEIERLDGSSYMFIDVSKTNYYDRNYNRSDNITEDFLKLTRFKFWKKLIDSPEIRSRMTDDIREYYEKRLDELKDYEFNYFNIKEVKMDLSLNFSANVKNAIIKIFDRLTYAYSTEQEKNIHYFNGWKTNKAFKINKKVIIPFYNLYDKRFNTWHLYKVRDLVHELKLIFDYLNLDLPIPENIYEIMRNEKQEYDLQYFSISIKKKGTVHITFKNQLLVDKLNRFGAMNKGWLPPSYSKKRYEQLNEEEKNTINSFESASMYNEVCDNKSIYMVEDNLIMIG